MTTTTAYRVAPTHTQVAPTHNSAPSRKPRPAGDIGTVFASFSGGASLPAEYAQLKRDIVRTPELAADITDSWRRLLARLELVTAEIVDKGNTLIPEIDYADLTATSRERKTHIRQAGAVIIRGIAPHAVEWEHSLREYVAANPVTGFPKDRPQVYELYWSPAQMAARADRDVLAAQRWANMLWHVDADPTYPIDLTTPIAYADRARMRNPGDTSFNLGPHADSGGLELWEDKAYRRCFEAVFTGEWERYDAFDASLRDPTNANLHDAPAYCGVFRTWQGWLSLSSTGPGEGTLRVFPALREATAYVLLRPFFRAVNTDPLARGYLDADNWVLDLDSATYPGVVLGKTQELNAETHPHLRLKECMVPIPRVEPGDYVFWHCEGIHAVEPVHNGTTDSSVLYLAACPLTPRNAEHLRDQRVCLAAGESSPGFPGGDGEGSFTGRGTAECVSGTAARLALGLEAFDAHEAGLGEGARRAREVGNEILFG